MKTLIQASEFHLADCRYRNLSKATMELYEKYEELFIQYLVDHDLSTAPNALNAGNVRAATEWLGTRGTGGKRDGQFARLSFVGTMKIWAKFLFSEDVLEHDPLARLKRPKVVKIARRPLEAWEVQALRGAMLGTFTGQRDIAVFSLLLATGMRIGEVCRLSMNDVDMEAYTVLAHGKGNKERMLRFGDGSRGGGKVANRLRDYLKVRRPPNPKIKAFFLNQFGKPMTTAGYGAAFRKACIRAEITAGTEVHRTRHTFATHYLISHPGDVEGLRYMLGHLDPEEYRTYAGEAGRRLAELAGDDVGASDMLEHQAPRPPAVTPSTRHPDKPRPLRALSSKARPNASSEMQALLNAVKGADPELRKALLKALLNEGAA